MTKSHTFVLFLPTLLLNGCGLGLSSYTTDDTASADQEEDDDGGIGGGSGNSSDTGLGGSGSGGAGGDNGEGSDGGSADDIAVSRLSPDYGTTAGGTVVEITGGPFDETAEVYFGSARGSVISTSESALTVETPAVTEEGLYPVTVRAAAGEGSLETGFIFWADGAGMNGTIGSIEFIEQVGSYWGTNTSFGSASVYFVSPTAIEWYELFAPSLDTCRNEDEYTFTGTVSIYDPGVSSIRLAGSRTMDLSWDADYGRFTLPELTTSQWAANLSYELQPMAGGVFPEVGVSAFASTASVPTLYSPSVGGSRPPNISPNPTFSWAPSGAEWVLITLGIHGTDGTGWDEVINCVVQDDGSFRVDTGQFSQWPYNRQIDVIFGPARKATGVLPWNGGRSGVVGMTRIYGAGITTY
ncbi:MAG: IPT/TIG domain-containing protein [Myxococcota bacterium]|nr:IPT/TIG domain-containing protein [Myxococcota bacterium]